MLSSTMHWRTKLHHALSARNYTPVGNADKPCQPKVGHVSFLESLDHTQMRAGALLCPSQLSGSERDSQTPERALVFDTILMHVSTGPSRSVPGYECPFTEQTEHIQKRARLQPVGCYFMLTPDLLVNTWVNSAPKNNIWEE